MNSLVSENLINNSSKKIISENKFRNWIHYFEKANQKKSDIVLDTSSVNKIVLL